MVANFDFDTYINKLEGFELPSEINDIPDEMNSAVAELEEIRKNKDSLPFDGNNSAWIAIKEKITVVSGLMTDISSDVSATVDKANAFDVNQIVTELQTLKTDLPGDSQVKEEIYSETAFIKYNTLSFISQFSTSLIENFGACEVKWFIL